MLRDNGFRGFFKVRFSRLLLAGLLSFASGCGLLKERQRDGSIDMQTVIEKPLTPEQSGEILEEAGDNWLYGSGLGQTTLTAGSVFVFPPYALYVVGNGILWLSGYEPIHISDALPDDEREQWNEAYDTVISGPGRLTAAVAGKEYRTQDVAKERIKAILKREETGAAPPVKGLKAFR